MSSLSLKNCPTADRYRTTVGPAEVADNLTTNWFNHVFLNTVRVYGRDCKHWSISLFVQGFGETRPCKYKLYCIWHTSTVFNTLRPRQHGHHFADDTFKRIFMNENVRISIDISLKFVPKCLINNIQALVQIMAWRRPGDKPLSEPMMVNLLTHIYLSYLYISRLYGPVASKAIQ